MIPSWFFGTWLYSNYVVAACGLLFFVGKNKSIGNRSHSYLVCFFLGSDLVQLHAHQRVHGESCVQHTCAVLLPMVSSERNIDENIEADRHVEERLGKVTQVEVRISIYL